MENFLEGLSLMAIGMGTVFAFLTLLVLCITLASAFITRFFPEQNSESSSSEVHTEQELLAVISAAIHRFRNKKIA